ncbi:alkaline phosphatase D family protein [Enterovibrio paralichthyis]|uniref:alkaline phosphatase D family protein n=1 Tax=Enterovibrio paralichthyis TaxID=2853805 RepID=UPI001C4708B1|nr:alkaline phosphatase D family protein [Enterovibrio paralichthyis]MBV7297367.1 alkaline phosphatase D family protein [Enterovibrio paralichthyis]
MSEKAKSGINRRHFIAGTAAASGTLLLGGVAPAFARGDTNRPSMPYGVASGDVSQGQAMIWSSADSPAQMWVDVSYYEDFRKFITLQGPNALAETGFASKLALTDLAPGQKVFYRVRYQSLKDWQVWGEPVVGSFSTPPAIASNIRFLWSGDTAGQGWGINEEWGGMRIYETMRQTKPDFFIHCGDTIYADGPIKAEVKLDNGDVWKNVVTPEKSKVAETLQEFRGNFAYNLMDKNVRAFNQEVPMIVQWDDHETVNNWYPAEVLNDPRYQNEQSVALLSARARRAFFEMNPIRSSATDPQRIYRKFHYGPLLDVFAIDMRSYRGDNGANNQTTASAETAFLGSKQILWLKQQLLASKATWKVIASDMPIGMIVYDDWKNKSTFENLANGDGAPKGRELEMVELLRFIKQNRIENVVWLTADVHYTAAHYYDPDKAQFQDFTPFYEFVSGPLNAGTFGPNDMDNTFGPQVLYSKHPEGGKVNLPPSAGLQFFGQVDIDAESEEMTVTLKDLAGSSLYSKKLTPVKQA